MKEYKCPYLVRQCCFGKDWPRARMRSQASHPTTMKNAAPTAIRPFVLAYPGTDTTGGLSEGEAGQIASASADSVAMKKDKPRALVVDDAPDVAEMVTILLRHAGYEVESALSARAALNAASSARFDVIVSDIGMPEMNGYELAERLRAMPEYAGIPMVAVTGFTMYDDRERAIAAGFDGFLTKPINTHDLIDTLERLRS